MSNGHIAEILENAKKALQAHIRAHTGGVWRELQGKTGIGSATCIRIADRLFLATAAHNFDVLLHGGKVTFFSSSMRSTTNLKDIARNYSEYGKDGTLDCAWIEIEPDSAARAKLEGLPLKYVVARHQMDLEARDTSDYNVVGMPWEMHKFYDEGGTRHYQIPVIVYNTRPHKDAKPGDDNLLLEYEEHAILEGEAVKLPHPGGVSGGGVWFIPDVTPKEIWTPANNPLCGINLLYAEATHKLTALRIHHWLTLVLQDNPELEEEIAPLLS